MPNVQHADLTDPFIHEPKGASTAAAKEVLFANGDGTTSFRPITEADIPTQNPMEYLGYCVSYTDQASTIHTSVEVGDDYDGFSSSDLRYDSTDKALKFYSTGFFLVKYTVIAGNTSVGGGGYSSLFIRTVYDGAYNLDETPVVVYTPNAHDHREVVTITRYLEVESGDIDTDTAYLRLYLEDDGGSSTVGLFSHTKPKPAWDDVPSVHVSAYRLW